MIHYVYYSILCCTYSSWIVGTLLHILLLQLYTHFTCSQNCVCSYSCMFLPSIWMRIRANNCTGRKTGRYICFLSTPLPPSPSTRVHNLLHLLYIHTHSCVIVQCMQSLSQKTCIFHKITFTVINKYVYEGKTEVPVVISLFPLKKIQQPFFFPQNNPATRAVPLCRLFIKLK